MLDTKKIIILGGGSAGWMSACSLIKAFPNSDITLIESPNIPTVGVGESTTDYMRDWVDYLGLKDEEWMPACDATYKYGLRFDNWSEDTFYYLFGSRDERTCSLEYWFSYMANHKVDGADYSRLFHDHGVAVEQGRIVPERLLFNSGFHFDAIKFAIYLRDHYAKPHGVKHVQAMVTEVKTDENGVSGLVLDNGDTMTANLYFDCTGFAGLLIDKTLQTPWISFEDKLCNNRTWAVQIPYENKEEQLKPYTTCTAMDYGWVWQVPVWNRIGTGYNYCDKFVTPEKALEEFKKHLGPVAEGAKFRDLTWKTGVRDKVWNKNVIAIGLSGGFIEPLESGGLYSVHEFLNAFLDVTESKPVITKLTIDSFNHRCKKIFVGFADFVELHYTITSRKDTPYWDWYTSKDIDHNSLVLEIFDRQHVPFKDTTTLNDIWVGLSMLFAGHKHQLINPRKVAFIKGKYKSFLNDEDINNAIRHRLSLININQEQYKKAIEFYREGIYRAS